MTNKHILVVEKWLANSQAVSLEQLEDNAKSAQYSMEGAIRDRKRRPQEEGDLYVEDANALAASHAAVEAMKAPHVSSDPAFLTAARFWVKQYHKHKADF